MAPVVHIREAAAGYAGRTVLREIDLVIERGDRIAILGPSGSGKTTLLNLIYERCRAQAALIPQGAALVRTLSVFHNVFMGRLDRHSTWFNLKTLVRPGPREVAEVRNVLEAVGLGDELFRKAGTLSGGQQQRTSVARALFNGRPMAIGDEPVSALDVAQGSAVLAKLGTHHETLVLALHDVPLALAHATRILAIRHGRISLDRPARELTPGDLARFYEP